MAPGLCEFCEYSRKVPNRAGSVFWLCEAHRDHPGMPKYPPLPVLRCDVFRPNGRQTDEKGAKELDHGK